MQIELVIERQSVNKLNKTKIDLDVHSISNSAEGRANCPGVTGKASKVEGPKEVVNDKGQNRYEYRFTVVVEKKNFRSEAAASKCLLNAKKHITRSAEGREWIVKGDTTEAAEATAIAESRVPFRLPELTPEVMQTEFAGIYERDAHIRMIHASMYTAVETKFDERNHTLLYGEPAAAKTMLFERFKEWYEREDGTERVALINATTLTKSGLENWILDRAKMGVLQEVLWFDELEKGKPEDFHCLLNIMDGTGEIARLNSKIGKQSASAKILVWGVCNNEQKIRSWESGALWSRFNKKYPCVRPSRELMLEIALGKIADRQARGLKANTKWAYAAVNYAFDVEKDNDPRFVLSMLDGRDGLLDGSYFKDIEAIKKAASRKVV